MTLVKFNFKKKFDEINYTEKKQSFSQSNKQFQTVTFILMQTIHSRKLTLIFPHQTIIHIIIYSSHSYILTPKTLFIHQLYIVQITYARVIFYFLFNPLI